MSQEKEDFISGEVVSEELSVHANSLYRKVLQICKLERNYNDYEEHAVVHLKNIARCVNGSLKGEKGRFFIDTFNLLKKDESITVALLLRALPEVEDLDSGGDLLEGISIFQNFKDDLLRGCEPSSKMDLMTDDPEDGEFSTQDSFFSFYPVYLIISDPEKVQEIEKVVSCIEDRDVVSI
jgi:hypothetical protein